MKATPPASKRRQHSHSFEDERKELHRRIFTSAFHDLKTPLYRIISSLEIFERTKTKLTQDKQDILINTALQETYRLDDFITNMLDMVRLESGMVKVKKESYRMDLLLEDCRTLLDGRLSQCKISIKVVPRTFPIVTDQALLMRAICIVLDNAVQYAYPRPVISVECRKTGKQAVIQIKDNGPGIEESRLKEIFSMDVGLFTEDIKRAKTGLGLPICREIMRLLGGTITVSNLPGNKGAVFTLTFAA